MPTNELCYLACVLREPTLLTRDAEQAFDELAEPEIRQMVVAVRGGASAADVWFEAAEEVKAALEPWRTRLPRSPEELADAFEQICLSIKVEAVKRHIERIDAELRLTQGASDLSDEARRVMEDSNKFRELYNRLNARRTKRQK